MATLTQDDILSAIDTMTVLQLNDLVKALEEKFGVSAAAPIMMAGGAAGGPAAAAEEQSEFDVILDSAGDKKIQVLKVVREATGLGLKEAKDLVDNAPKPIKEKIKKEEAEKIKAQLEAEGAKVSIK
jgi:large subunit ribosomal protein L7/L12